MKYLISIIVICLILLMIEIKYFLLDKNQYNILSIDEINFRTGDLLFMKGNNSSLLSYNSINKTTNINLLNIINASTVTRFDFGYYTHVAFIMCFNNVPYVYELNDNEPKQYRYCNYLNKIRSNKKPVLLDINYLYKYNGHCYHYSYLGPTILNPEKFITEYKNKTLLKGITSIIKTLSKCYESIQNIEYITCCTITAEFLKNNNVIKNSNTLFFTPQSLFNTAIVNNNKYDKIPTLIKNYYSIYTQ